MDSLPRKKVTMMRKMKPKMRKLFRPLKLLNLLKVCIMDGKTEGYIDTKSKFWFMHVYQI